MKKSLLTLSLLAVTLVAANAQKASFRMQHRAVKKVPAAALQLKKAPERKTLNTQMAPSVTFSAASIAKAKQAFRAEGEDSVSALYKMPTGIFVAGLSPDWYSYSNDLYFAPALEEVVFPNYSYWDTTKDVSISWTLATSQGDTEMEQNEEYDGIMTPFGYYNIPTLTVTQGTASESYQFSPDGTTAVYVGGGTDSLQTGLGNADLNLGFYGGFQGGIGFNALSEFNESGKNLIGFAETFDKPIGHTYATTVSLHAYFKEVPTEALGANDTLFAEICTFSEEGLVPYALAICTADDVAHFDENGNVTYVFRFVEDDEDFGIIDVPVVLPNEDFVVLMTGFDKANKAVTAPFAPADGWAGNGYAILDDGSLSTIGYRSNPTIPQTNLTISFDAALPLIQLTDEKTTVMFPDEGGYGVTGYDPDDGEPYNDIDFYTLSPKDQWMVVEAPEWVEEIEYDESYLEQYGILLAYAVAEPLPADVEGRKGEIIFSLYGKECSVVVGQGNVDLGVEGVKVAGAKKQDAVYNLMGQRVSANAKGLLIKGGKKFLAK